MGRVKDKLLKSWDSSAEAYLGRLCGRGASKSDLRFLEGPAIQGCLMYSEEAYVVICKFKSNQHMSRYGVPLIYFPTQVLALSGRSFSFCCPQLYLASDWT
jgi:hypothetical protein